MKLSHFGQELLNNDGSRLVKSITITEDSSGKTLEIHKTSYVSKVGSMWNENLELTTYDCNVIVLSQVYNFKTKEFIKESVESDGIDINKLQQALKENPIEVSKYLNTTELDLGSVIQSIKEIAYEGRRLDAEIKTNDNDFDIKSSEQKDMIDNFFSKEKMEFLKEKIEESENNIDNVE